MLRRSQKRKSPSEDSKLNAIKWGFETGPSFLFVLPEAGANKVRWVLTNKVVLRQEPKFLFGDAHLARAWMIHTNSSLRRNSYSALSHSSDAVSKDFIIVFQNFIWREFRSLTLIQRYAPHSSNTFFSCLNRSILHIGAICNILWHPSIFCDILDLERCRHPHIWGAKKKLRSQTNIGVRRRVSNLYLGSLITGQRPPGTLEDEKSITTGMLVRSAVAGTYFAHWLIAKLPKTSWITPSSISFITFTLPRSSILTMQFVIRDRFIIANVRRIMNAIMIKGFWHTLRFDHSHFSPETTCLMYRRDWGAFG